MKKTKNFRNNRKKCCCGLDNNNGPEYIVQTQRANLVWAEMSGSCINTIHIDTPTGPISSASTSEIIKALNWYNLINFWGFILVQIGMR